jgi:hypothetical protein
VLVPQNKRMKQTSLSAAPGKMEAPPRALRRFAAVRTGSQLIWKDPLSSRTNES